MSVGRGIVCCGAVWTACASSRSGLRSKWRCFLRPTVESCGSYGTTRSALHACQLKNSRLERRTRGGRTQRSTYLAFKYSRYVLFIPYSTVSPCARDYGRNGHHLPHASLRLDCAGCTPAETRPVWRTPRSESDPERRRKRDDSRRERSMDGGDRTDPDGKNEIKRERPSRFSSHEWGAVELCSSKRNGVYSVDEVVQKGIL
jgi:hypothetical protein